MTSIHELFKRLHDEVWKQGKPFIQNYQGVNILDRTVSWLGRQGLVLVRDEYLRIWEYILSLRNDALATGRMFQDGLVVTGHPGIGKSMFSLYALGAALEAHIPVVVCRETNFCHIFDATGVRESALGRDDIFAAPFHALYLFDSYYDLHSPPSCFLGRSGVLVHTVGPGNWTKWKWTERSHNALFWIMGVWTRAEMQALQRTAEALTHPEWTNPAPPGKAVYTPLELFDILGPCARRCVCMSGNAKTQAGPKVDLDSYYRAPLACFFSSPELDAILSMVRHRLSPPDFYDDGYLHRLIFLYNAGSQNPSRTPEFGYAIPTLFAREMLTEHLRRANSMARPDQLRAATKLVGVPSIAAAFYQPLIIAFLRETRTGRVCRVADDEGTAFRLGPGLALPAGVVEFDPKVPPSDVEDERVLVLPPGFTAFDVLVVSEGRTRVTMLRMADTVMEKETGTGTSRGTEMETDTEMEPDGGGQEDEGNEDGDEDHDMDEDEVDIEAGVELGAEDQDEGGEEQTQDEDRTKSEVDPDAAVILSVVDAFDKLLPRPETVKWTLVYVALKGDRAKDVAEHHKTRERFGNLYPRMQLGWMKLGSRNERTRRLLNAFEKGFAEEKDRQATQMRFNAYT